MIKIKNLKISTRTQGQWTTTIPDLLGDSRVAVLHSHVIDWTGGNRVYHDVFKLGDKDGQRRINECHRWLEAIENGSHVLIQRGKGDQQRRFDGWKALWTVIKVEKFTGEDGKYGVRLELDQRIAG